MSKELYLYVEAEVRYWEDANINGIEDVDGSLVPFRDGAVWKPTINLQTGKVVDWPKGTFARFHYKACDQGEYWLVDKDKVKLAKWNGSYVPDSFLCFGANGYGDYIVFSVDTDGLIKDYKQPKIDTEDWTYLDTAEEGACRC